MRIQTPNPSVFDPLDADSCNEPWRDPKQYEPRHSLLVERQACALASEEVTDYLSLRRDPTRAVPLDNWQSQLDEVLDGVTRIFGIVKNLRAARGATPDTEPILVNQVVANALHLAAVAIPAKTTILRDLGLVVPVHGDHQRLSQVILNLVFNAVHAIEDAQLPSGNIFVRTWSDTRFTWVEIRDNGPGVPEEHREKIFEPFFTTRTTGSGLGLAVCRTMIRELGGELLHQPTPHNTGACFRISLPIWASETSTGGVQPQPA